MSEGIVLESLVGDLRAYGKLVPDSFQHVDQLMSERASNPDLRNFWFYTADGSGYFPEGNSVDWVITREAENLVLRHLNDKANSSFEQLINKGDYIPDNEEALASKRAKDSVVVSMKKLRLTPYDDRFCYLDIRTKDRFIKTSEGYKKPNAEEVKAMDRLGFSLENLAVLSSETTKVYVVNPGYARKTLKNSNSASLWRASWLWDFYYNSNFYAGLRDIDDYYRLRGVSRAPKAPRPEGEHHKNDIHQHYKALLQNPTRAVQAMDDETATGLLKLVAEYLSTKEQLKVI